MFQLLERSTETCLGFKVDGEVKAEDYNTLKPILENAVRAHGTINLVVEVEEFEGYKDLDAVLADAKIGVDKIRDISKIAVVSPTTWQEVAIKLFDPFALKTDLKHFEPDQRDAAWTWACGQSWKQS